MGWVILAVLTLMASAAAISLAIRAQPRGRAELFLAAGLLWNFLIVTPIYILGYAHRLTARNLGLTAAVIFIAVFLLSLPRDWRRGLREVAAAASEIVVLPFDAIGIAARARSLVVLPLAMSAWLIMYTAIGAYYIPSWRQWDSLWYHEPIIGYVIQEHGFGILKLPGDIQKINGFPRLCEMTNLWFVIFTDRRLIEVASALLAPPLMVGTYALARRFFDDALACMGFAAAVLLMPATAYLLASSYIDIQVALFLVGATYYVTRPELRYADLLIAVVCLTMALGSKYLVAPDVGVLSVIALVRAFKQRGFNVRTLGVVAVGLALIGAMGASIYWRNWVLFKNPMWPDLTYQKHGLHIVSEPPGADLLDMNLTPKDLIDNLVSIPNSNKGALGRKGELYDYGFAITWLVFPLGLIGAWFAMLASLRTWVGRIFKRKQWISPDAENALLVLLPTLAGLYVSPSLWTSRYHIGHVSVLAAMVAWLGGRRGWGSLARDAAVTCSVASIIVFFWVTPRWWYTPSELIKLVRIPYPAREVTPAAEISPDLWIAGGSAITKEVGLQREKTVGPGAIVAYNDSEQFIGLLWNNDFSNRLVYVPEGPGYVDRVQASLAIWVYCRYGDPSCEEFRKRGWKDVGIFNVENWGVILRRAVW